jgi:hypothetical protein
MLSEKAFGKGLKIIRAVFRYEPDEETAQIWFRYLCPLSDEEFLKGVFLLGHPQKGLRDVYPHTNIPACVYEYIEKAKEEERKSKPRIKEQWEIEREKLIQIEYARTKEEALERLLNKKPELEALVDRIGRQKLLA